MAELLFKEAETDSEFEQIHRLNHRVFAEEIAQHRPNPSGLLVDRYHDNNRYFIAVRGEVVVGMVSVHSGPVFSVASRLQDTSVLRSLPHPVEVRLLAIDPSERNRTVLAGLLWQVYRFAVSANASHVLISGIAQRQSMYHKLGFRPMGPAVRDGAASFVPMVMPIDAPSHGTIQRIRLHVLELVRSCCI